MSKLRSRPHSICVFACATSLAFQAAAVPPAMPEPAVPNGLGVNIHFTDPRPGEMEMLAAGGFRWVRMDFGWSQTEPERGHYDFSAYDRLMSALDAHHIRAIFILDYGNRLYEPESSVTTESGRRAFANWAAAAAKHFEGRSIFWEIWNEPNGGFWKPKADVNQYSAMALAASRAIRKAAPDATIIGPATSGVDFNFLESCFKAGLLEWWDAVSVHPYRQSGPETAAADYGKLRALIAQYAPKGKTIPILSGEWGYSSVWNHFDERKQGDMLAREWLFNLFEHIPVSIWYDWHDDGQNPKDPEHHFGTVANAYHANQSPVYEPKPAYVAAKTLTTVLDGYVLAKRLAVGAADDYVLLFQKGNESRLAVWTTGAAAHSVTIPCSPGKFEIIGEDDKHGTPVSTEKNELVFTAEQAPRYLIPGKPDPVLNAAPEAK